MNDPTKRVVYRIQGMERARVQRSLIYKQDGNAPLLMDVYSPQAAGPAEHRGAVIFVHGGPLPKEMTPPREWAFFQSYGELAAASGLVGVTFNHRLHDRTDYARSQEDIAAAIEYVRLHAHELDVDADRIGFWVFSGGGPQLSWLLRERPPWARCAIAFYAMLDVRHVVPPDAPAALIEAAHGLSPTTYLETRAAGLPMYVARAGLDAPLINQGLDAFVAEALRVNASIDIANHAGGQHGFDFLDDDDRTRQIIADALRFARKHLVALTPHA